jgi:hypothetical protein
LQIAFQNEDDFVRNLCTLRAEVRVAVSVLLPKGLIIGSFAGTVATAAVPTHTAQGGATHQTNVKR